MQLLSLLGIEVPGLEMSLSEIPNQYTSDGKPQVLVYGPTNCNPTAQTLATLAQQNIPYSFRNSNSIGQEELGAVVLSVPKNAPGETPLVLINGRVLVNPSVSEILTEYNQMLPTT